MKRTMIRRLLGGLALLTLSGSLASASSITWYNNIFFPYSAGGATNTPQVAPNLYTTPFTSTVDIPQFDTSTAPSGYYYVLTSVQIVMNWAVQGTVEVLNNSAISRPFTNASAAIPVSLVGPDGTTVFATAVAGPVSGTAAAGPSVITSVPGLIGSGSANNTVIGGALANYQGSGVANLGFSFTSSDGLFGGVGTSLFFGGSADVGASIQVTYNYDTLQAPEPGTFGIFGAGLAGLVFFVRRRK